MGIAVREISLEFANARAADEWVAAHVPSGLVVGPITWELIIHQAGTATVRLVQGYQSVAVAGDWQAAALPELDGATSMTVAAADAVLYVGGDVPGEEGPGRVWSAPNSFGS